MPTVLLAQPPPLLVLLVPPDTLSLLELVKLVLLVAEPVLDKLLLVNFVMMDISEAQPLTVPNAQITVKLVPPPMPVPYVMMDSS